jgi:hypothetical protein
MACKCKYTVVRLVLGHLAIELAAHVTDSFPNHHGEGECRVMCPGELLPVATFISLSFLGQWGT